MKNVIVRGRMHVLYVAEEEPIDESSYNVFDALQVQAEHIKLLEEQNSALIRQEKILLRLLELSSKSDQVENLVELKRMISSYYDNSSEEFGLAGDLIYK